MRPQRPRASASWESPTSTTSGSTPGSTRPPKARASCRCSVSSIISVVDELLAGGHPKVNDPGEPWPDLPVRQGHRARSEPPTATATAPHGRGRGRATRRACAGHGPRLRACFADAGLRTGLTDEMHRRRTWRSARSVPRDGWCSRSDIVAQAFQEALFLAVAPGAAASVLARPSAGPGRRRRRRGSRPGRDPGASHEVGPAGLRAGDRRYRSRRPTAWCSRWDGIPCYPTLADGAEPRLPVGGPARGARGAPAGARDPPGGAHPDAQSARPWWTPMSRPSGPPVSSSSPGPSTTRASAIPIEPLCADGSPPVRSRPGAVFWEGDLRGGGPPAPAGRRSAGVRRCRGSA